MLVIFFQLHASYFSFNSLIQFLQYHLITNSIWIPTADLWWFSWVLHYMVNQIENGMSLTVIFCAFSNTSSLFKTTYFFSGLPVKKPFNIQRLNLFSSRCKVCPLVIWNGINITFVLLIFIMCALQLCCHSLLEVIISADNADLLCSTIKQSLMHNTGFRCVKHNLKHGSVYYVYLHNWS